MNPANMIKQYMLQGLTPRSILQRLNVQNPILSNVISMAQNGDSKGVENFARNICKQRGLDFDQEFSKFKDSFR